MRYLVTTLAAAALVGCSGAKAYGPSGDDRLDAATANIEKPSGDITAVQAENLAQLQSADCTALAEARSKVKTDPSEEGRLAGYTGLIGQLRAKKTTIEEVLASSPGLAYFQGKAADGATYDIPALVRTCEENRLEAEADLDSLIRDVLAVPIVEEIEGKGRRRRTVSKPRVDFDLLANAVNVLEPADRTNLLGEVDSAKERLAKANEPRKRRRR